ncbi:hypothetical protein AB0D11_07705 [Streptomyces monashensis]|uniref:hypothetical protein n=1 Tax=Streptomyces monashensis TaxID=1678012 RepID=UPI003403B038
MDAGALAVHDDESAMVVAGLMRLVDASHLYARQTGAAEEEWLNLRRVLWELGNREMD